MCSTVLSLTPQRKRASTTLGPTGMSLLCSAAFSWLFHAPVAPVPAVRLIYGIVVVADSPAYSVSFMELVPPRSVADAFSLQMLFGWAVTVVAPAVFGMGLFAPRCADGRDLRGCSSGRCSTGRWIGFGGYTPSRP